MLWMRESRELRKQVQRIKFKIVKNMDLKDQPFCFEKKI